MNSSIFCRSSNTTDRYNIEVNPNVVIEYNKYMGGVDLADSLIRTYSPAFRSMKMWKKVFINMLLLMTCKNVYHTSYSFYLLLLYRFYPIPLLFQRA